MGSIISKWILPGIITIVVGTIAALLSTQANIEQDLTDRSTTAIAAYDDHSASNWAKISFSGRDGIISGVTTNPAAADALIAQISALHGVRTITSTIELAPSASPYPFSALLSDGQISLSGGVPSLALRDALVEKTGATDTGLELLTGAPNADWLEITTFTVSQLDGLESGQASLSDLSLSVSGIAKDPTTYATATTALRAELPHGITLENMAVEPAFVENYFFSAHRANGAITLLGYVPDETMRMHIAEITGASTDELQIARGASENFMPALDYGLDLLKNLSTGELNLNADTLSISGTAASQLGYAAIASINSSTAPDGINLDIEKITPATANPYFWSTQKRENGSLTLRGYIPDEATRTALMMRAGNIAIDHMQIANGAPQTFYEDALVSISALTNLETGRAGYSGNAWYLSGQPGTDAAKEAASDSLVTARTHVDNWNISLADAPPVPVIPYIWSAQKFSNARIVILGNVPDETTRTAIMNRAGANAVDQMQISFGAPDHFYEDTLVAISALLPLETGRTGHSADGWFLNGHPTSKEARSASTNALLTARTHMDNWNVSVAEAPPVPVIPYTWSVEKLSNGVFLISGHIPDEATQNALLIRAGEETINHANVAFGAPDHFYEDALVAISALDELEFGRAGYSGEYWFLLGQPVTENAAEAASNALLTARTNSSEWHVNLASIPPVTFTANLSSQSDVSLSGHVPNARTATYLGLISGRAATNELTIQTLGMPENFSDNAIAGIRALRLLIEGQLSFENNIWALTGKAQHAPARDEALSQIAKLENSQSWETDISLPTLAAICREQITQFTAQFTIEFEPASARLKERSLPLIQNLAHFMSQCPDSAIHVEGHTDNQGDFTDNLQLSTDRADAIVTALIKFGIDIHRLNSIGYGQSQPIADNDTAQGRQANRRIVIKILD